MSRRRKILVAVGIILGVAILLPVIRHYQLRVAVENYRAELKARGEPIELAQVLPPPAKPKRNGTDLLLKAAPLVDDDKTFLRTNPIPAMKMVSPGKAMVCACQAEVRVPGEYGFTNSWAEAQVAEAQNDEALMLLRQIINRPELDFHIRYEQGFYDGSFFTNLQLVVMKQAALHLKSAAVIDLHRGNPSSAIENVRAALALANAMQSERLEITELVRIAIAAIAQGATWEILQATNLTDTQLSALQSDWSRLDFLQGHRDALNMEDMVGDIEVARWRSSNREMRKLIDLFGNVSRSLGVDDDNGSTLFQRVKLSGQIFLWRYWWSYSDELRSLKGQMALMEAARYAGTNGAFLPAFTQQKARLDELGISNLNDPFASVFSGKLDFHSMLSESILILGNSFKKVMNAECSQRMTVTAIALKRFQLNSGNYPPDLNSLVPEFIPAVPLDSVDGKPLRYRRNADGTFLLYSVGENGVDDGGDSSLEKGTTSSNYSWQNIHALDWVWPQPATPEEVRFFYDHPPK